MTAPPSTSPLTRDLHCPPLSFSTVPWGQKSRMTGSILQLGKLSSRQIHWLAQSHTSSWCFLLHHCSPAGRSEQGRGEPVSMGRASRMWRQQGRGTWGAEGPGWSQVGTG